jgi:outer membrane receptor for monomeric catechols
MTKIASFAAVTLTAALVSGLVQFAPVAQATAQTATLDSNIATVSASQKTWRIMPPAQRKYCSL